VAQLAVATSLWYARRARPARSASQPPIIEGWGRGGPANDRDPHLFLLALIISSEGKKKKSK